MYAVRHSRVDLAVHLLVPAAFALYLILVPFEQTAFVEASLGYLSFSNEYPIGYPLFLALMKAVSGSVEFAIWVQIALFALSVCALSLSVAKSTGSNMLGILVGAPVLINPFMLDYLSVLLPSSLFVTFTIFLISFIMSALTRSHVLNKMAIGFCVGVLIMLQSSGWAYVAVLIFALPFIARKNQESLLRTALLSLMTTLCLVLVEQSAYRAIHAEHVRYPSAPYLFARTALMDTAQTSPYASKDARTTIWGLIENDLQVKREALNKVSDEARQALEDKYQAFVRQSFAQQELQEAAKILDKPVERVMLDLSVSRIVQDPGAFASVALRDYRLLWEQYKDLLQPQLWLSLILCLIGVWFWLIARRCGTMLGVSLVSAFALQAQVLWIAVTGYGPAGIVLMMTPLMLIALLCLMVGFYNTYIMPSHIDE